MFSANEPYEIYSEQECIPVECVPPTAVAVTGGLHTPPEQGPPKSRHSPEQTPPSQIPLNFPLGCGPGTDPPSTSLLGVGLDQIPLNFPLGCGPGNLQGMLGYHHPPPLWRPAARHAGIPPAMHAGIAHTPL